MGAQLLRGFCVISPAAEDAGIQLLFQGRVGRGGPEDDARARPRGTGDGQPKVIDAGLVHPVLGIEEDNTVDALLRMGRQHVGDRVVGDADLPCMAFSVAQLPVSR